MADRLALAVTVACCVAWPGAHTRGASRDEARFVLKSIQELRRTELVPDDGGGFSVGEPGLQLTIQVALPVGRRLVEITEPQTVHATDSTGRDLGAIEPNMFGRTKHLELVTVWSDPPQPPEKFRFKLALPDRQATTFDLTAGVIVVTDGGVHELVVETTPGWMALEPKLEYGEIALKLTRNARGAQLHFKPAGVRDWIEEAVLVDGENEFKSSSLQYNDEFIAWWFEGEIPETARAKLRVRRKVERRPMVISLDDQPLP
jgi:hypothetical protein